jgi:hypothetical protein
VILGDYGYDLAGLGPHIDDPDFLKDEWLTRWYGEPVASYVQDEMDAVALLDGAKP